MSRARAKATTMTGALGQRLGPKPSIFSVGMSEGCPLALADVGAGNATGNGWDRSATMLLAVVPGGHALPWHGAAGREALLYRQLLL